MEHGQVGRVGQAGGSRGAPACYPYRPHGPHQAYDVEWITDVGRLDALEGEWRALEESVAQRTHLSTYDFLATWYRHYAGAYGGEPLIGLTRRDRRLVGLAPFVVKRGTLGRIPVRRLELAPSDVPAGEFLIDDRHNGALDALLDDAMQTANVDLVCLDGFDPGADQVSDVRRAADRHRFRMELEDHAYAMVDLTAGYDTYYRGLSGHYRRNLKQKARKIEAEGAVIDGVHLTATSEIVERAIERLITINEASYKLEGQRLADPHRDFLADVIRRLARQGTLGLPILSIGGHDAAFILGVVERGCFYDITLAYDEQFATVSPGAYLMQRALDNWASAGIHRVISHGAHEYKKHWASAFVPQKRIFLFAPTVRASATRVVRFGLQPMWRRLRPAPATHR